MKGYIWWYVFVVAIVTSTERRSKMYDMAWLSLWVCERGVQKRKRTHVIKVDFLMQRWPRQVTYSRLYHAHTSRRWYGAQKSKRSWYAHEARKTFARVISKASETFTRGMTPQPGVELKVHKTIDFWYGERGRRSDSIRSILALISFKLGILSSNGIPSNAGLGFGFE